MKDDKNNTGHRNTGHRNTGDWNTGHRNTGDWNTGDWNTGDWNTGDWNTGDWNTGDLNTDTPTVRLFNKDSGIEFFGEKHRRLKEILFRLSKPLCEWISECNMSKDDKEKYPTYKTTGGYLKVNEKSALVPTKEDEDFLRSLPNFDAEILKECSGIDLTPAKTVKIVVDGKEINISKECYADIVRQFQK